MIDFKKEIASQHKRAGPAENLGTVGIYPHSVQEACAKCFAVHILKFEILQIT